MTHLFAQHRLVRLEATELIELLVELVGPIPVFLDPVDRLRRGAQPAHDRVGVLFHEVRGGNPDVRDREAGLNAVAKLLVALTEQRRVLGRPDLSQIALAGRKGRYGRGLLARQDGDVLLGQPHGLQASLDHVVSGRQRGHEDLRALHRRRVGPELGHVVGTADDPVNVGPFLNDADGLQAELRACKGRGRRAEKGDVPLLRGGGLDDRRARREVARLRLDAVLLEESQLVSDVDGESGVVGHVERPDLVLRGGRSGAQAQGQRGPGQCGKSACIHRFLPLVCRAPSARGCVSRLTGGLRRAGRPRRP